MRIRERLELPLSEGVEILRPETVVLAWKGESRTVDVGLLCYLRRDTASKSPKRHRYDEASICPIRTSAIRKLIFHLSELCIITSRRPATHVSSVRTIVQFLKWADSRGLHSVLASQADTEYALEEYFSDLKEDVSQNKRNQSAAANTQREVLSALRRFFERDDFGSKIQLLRGGRKFINHTEVPDEAMVSPFLACAEAVFDAVVENLSTPSPYPIRVQTDFAHRWLMPKKSGSAARDLTSDCVWDYEIGKLHSREALTEIMKEKGEHFPNTKAGQLLREANKILNLANGNLVNNIRLSHASLASQCFAVLFMAETGGNLAQVQDLEWNDELKEALHAPIVVRQSFRAIKYRANSKEIEFRISLAFLSKLKLYVKLRDYLLQKEQKKHFFISLTGRLAPAQLSKVFVEAAYNRMRSLGMPLAKLGAREWRAFKQDKAITKYGPVIGAKLVNQTVSTALRDYSNGTQSTHRTQMRTFFASVESTVLSPEAKLPDGALENGVGSCVDFLNPGTLSNEVPIRPDCKSTEGCLFCDKHKLLADATDVRKLISCRHCVRLTANRGASFEDYDQTFGSVLRRIDFLLDEVRRHNSDLVAHIETDVDVHGNLDAFWAGKLELLLELGLA